MNSRSQPGDPRPQPEAGPGPQPPARARPARVRRLGLLPLLAALCVAAVVGVLVATDRLRARPPGGVPRPTPAGQAARGSIGGEVGEPASAAPVVPPGLKNDIDPTLPPP